ncbi:hypothetical protein E4U42_007503 [Claviceps africana]|uniref:Uncharacterized protein n=1 Tax=Claviceps africana TaxID=83212 RepID=A0A8K0J0Y2_9HYPO|nr:hypothetical protein E4U42_007503 [Claviceps africana]
MGQRLYPDVASYGTEAKQVEPEGLRYRVSHQMVIEQEYQVTEGETTDLNEMLSRIGGKPKQGKGHGTSFWARKLGGNFSWKKIIGSWPPPASSCRTLHVRFLRIAFPAHMRFENEYRPTWGQHRCWSGLVDIGSLARSPVGHG